MAVLKDLIVHGASRFLNGIQTNYIQTDELETNSIKTNTLSADSGYFNYLKAIEGDVTSLTTEDLLATNATVVGLLDVQGEMHTNSWTNANIANIGGSFYIAPTIETQASTIIISYITPIEEGARSYYTISVSGAGLPTSESNVVNTGGVDWEVSSKVMITGSVIIEGITYPLGTCVGDLNAINGPNGTFIITNIFNSSDAVVGNSILDGSLHTLIEDFGVVDSETSVSITCSSENIKLSMYEIANNKPVGIMMTSYGLNKATYIDIYGGVNQKQVDIGIADPNVRIGYLGDGSTPYGLAAFNDSMTPYPQGWGIYTDNGYFKGTIVADSGRIGDGDVAWNIGSEEDRGFIWNGVSTVTSVETTGTYVGTDGFLNVSIDLGYTLTSDELIVSGKQYYTRSGNDYILVENPTISQVETYYEHIPIPFTQITDGILTAQGANLRNLNIYDINGNKRANIDTQGFNIYDGRGENTNTILASFTTKDNIPLICIGDKTQFHIEISDKELGFYQAENDQPNSKVAYIRGDEMFIRKTIVANSLDVGLSSSQTDVMTGLQGKGQWSWKVHEVNNLNNLSLKWID